MFCIKCGKPAIAGNFCRQCFLEKERLFELDDFTTKICPNCGTYADGDIENQIKSMIKTKNRINSCSVKTRTAGNRVLAKVTCAGIISPLKSLATQEAKATVTVKKLKCENCIKLLGGYYEAIFQIRGPSTDRIMNKLRKFLPNDSIIDISKIKAGYDIKLSDKKIAAIAIKRLREYFEITESYKLVGEKKGKRLYRNSYAIR